jgi:hypothetical protein
MRKRSKMRNQSPLTYHQKKSWIAGRIIISCKLLLNGITGCVDTAHPCTLRELVMTARAPQLFNMLVEAGTALMVPSGRENVATLMRPTACGVHKTHQQRTGMRRSAVRCL